MPIFYKDNNKILWHMIIYLECGKNTTRRDISKTNVTKKKLNIILLSLPFFFSLSDLKILIEVSKITPPSTVRYTTR